jgi:hypothetical protein
MPDNTLRPGGPRSAGSIPQRRVPQPWPKDRRFRILSMDGGGIRGVFPVTVLAELERRHCGGQRIGSYFDLIVGTSTGGILALGLGAGRTAGELQQLYVERGHEIFPERKRSLAGRLRTFFGGLSQWVVYRYERDAVAALLTEKLGDKLLGDSLNRLCIPAFDGKHSEVFVYKTPHHADYKFDRFEKMVTVGLATSAAPTFFQPLKHGGYQLVDGGVWANNPIMLGVIEALICFDLDPTMIDVLSIGCGDDPYRVQSHHLAFGGNISWARSIFAAMRLQSLAATNQARLLVGPPSILRVEPPTHRPPIDMDDWRRAVDLLQPAGVKAADDIAARAGSIFLNVPTELYVPVPAPAPASAST